MARLHISIPPPLVRQTSPLSIAEVLTKVTALITEYELRFPDNNISFVLPTNTSNSTEFRYYAHIEINETVQLITPPPIPPLLPPPSPPSESNTNSPQKTTKPPLPVDPTPLCTYIIRTLNGLVWKKLRLKIQFAKANFHHTFINEIKEKEIELLANANTIIEPIDSKSIHIPRMLKLKGPKSGNPNGNPSVLVDTRPLLTKVTVYNNKIDEKVKLRRTKVSIVNQGRKIRFEYFGDVDMGGSDSSSSSDSDGEDEDEGKKYVWSDSESEAEDGSDDEVVKMEVNGNGIGSDSDSSDDDSDKDSGVTNDSASNDKNTDEEILDHDNETMNLGEGESDQVNNNKLSFGVFRLPDSDSGSDSDEGEDKDKVSGAVEEGLNGADDYESEEEGEKQEEEGEIEDNDRPQRNDDSDSDSNDDDEEEHQYNHDSIQIDKIDIMKENESALNLFKSMFASSSSLPTTSNSNSNVNETATASSQSTQLQLPIKRKDVEMPVRFNPFKKVKVVDCCIESDEDCKEESSDDEKVEETDEKEGADEDEEKEDDEDLDAVDNVDDGVVHEDVGYVYEYNDDDDGSGGNDNVDDNNNKDNGSDSESGDSEDNEDAGEEQIEFKWDKDEDANDEVEVEAKAEKDGNSSSSSSSSSCPSSSDSENESANESDDESTQLVHSNADLTTKMYNESALSSAISTAATSENGDIFSFSFPPEQPPAEAIKLETGKIYNQNKLAQAMANATGETDAKGIVVDLGVYEGGFSFGFGFGDDDAASVGAVGGGSSSVADANVNDELSDNEETATANTSSTASLTKEEPKPPSNPGFYANITKPLILDMLTKYIQTSIEMDASKISSAVGWKVEEEKEREAWWGKRKVLTEDWRRKEKEGRRKTGVGSASSTGGGSGGGRGRDEGGKGK